MKIQKPEAFSLAECLISILLLSITMVASASFFFNSSKLSASDQHRRMAMELADTRLESLKALSWGSIVSNTWSNEVIGSLAATTTATVTTIGTYKQVQVISSWQEAGQNQSVNLVTDIAQ